MPRVYLKTHGCQMNEYDSARMADVLRAAGGYEQVDRPEEADLLLLNTCSIREKAQEKVFSQLGAWRALKSARPDVIIGVGGCVASQEGEGITERAPFVDLVFGPADAAPPAGDDRRAQGAGSRRRRRELSRDREVRPPAGAARRWRDGVRLDHRRLQQVLHVLRRAVHARRSRSAGRSSRSCRGPRSSPRRRCARSRCSARTSTAYRGRTADG